ncbi:energy transducer TonB [Hymenobacter lapidiphilus]|uniref:TonB family protein n=1 Tax=Hymenobacter lapidiphilus TaxID=2608003 RepID=A0A7Y7PRB7_9BACT|nr:TonB family protein [Hymenobacter lapidiphilus]
MHKTLLLSLLLLVNFRATAQAHNNELPFADYLHQNIRWPDSLPRSISGRVLVQFEVDKRGEIRNPAIVQSLHPLADAEALRLVKLLRGYFTPGRRNGRPVSTFFTMPLSFIGPDNDSTKIQGK